MADTSASIGNELKTTVLDLNDDCLISICRYLDQYELYALRDMHSRFINATEYCYAKMAAEHLWEFNYSNWLGGKHSNDLRQMLEYFGPYMRKVRIGKSFTRFVRENSISQSFLAERLANTRFLCLDYADHHEIDFVSALKHIEVLEVRDVDWMPLPGKWANLKKVTVSYPTFSAKRAEKLILFLWEHEHMQILRIAIPTMSGDYLQRDERWLFETISKMSGLCELDLYDFTPGFRLDLESLIVIGNKWSKLQKLHLPYVHWKDLDLSPHYLKNLTYLRVGQHVDVGTIIELVSGGISPALTHLDLFYNPVDVDDELLHDFIILRFNCAGLNQPIHINNLYLDETHNPGGRKWSEKFEEIKQNEELILCHYHSRDPSYEDQQEWLKEVDMRRECTRLTDLMFR